MSKKALVLAFLLGCSAAEPPAPNRAATIQALNERVQDEEYRCKFISVPSDPVDQCGIAPYWFMTPEETIFHEACAYHDQAYSANELAEEGDDVRQAVDYRFLVLMLEAVDRLETPYDKWVAHNQAMLMFFVARKLGGLWW